MGTAYISRDPEIMSGAPCFKGTRVLVQNLFDYLEGSSSLEDFLEDFPSVSREAAIAVLEAAKARLFADAPAAWRVCSTSAKDTLGDEYPDNLIRSGVRGKYTKSYREGTNIVLIDPDLHKLFPDSDAVNRALREYASKKRTAT
jgi:uncharacterized protein (DUF433 family)